MPTGKPSIRQRKASHQRTLAFQVLYSLSFTQVSDLDDLKQCFCNSPEHPGRPDQTAAPAGFAWELVEGVWKSSALLDSTIARYCHNWRVERLGKVVLTLLRLAVFELLFRDDIPLKVSINEALELNRQFGEDSAQSFINGILDAVAKALEKGEIPRPMPQVSAISQQAG